VILGLSRASYNTATFSTPFFGKRAFEWSVFLQDTGRELRGDQAVVVDQVTFRTMQLHRQRARQSSPGPSLFQLDQDEPAQVGKDQEMKVLREMNELQEFENDVCSPWRECNGAL